MAKRSTLVPARGSRRARLAVLLAAVVTAVAIPRSMASPAAQRPLQAARVAQTAQPRQRTQAAQPAARTPGPPAPSVQLRTAAIVSEPSMGVAAGRGTEPLKDLDIQPGDLGATEWNQLLDLAQKAGVSVIALDVNWAAYEPRGPARRYEFSELSRFVSDVLGRGLELRFQLVGFPQWARSPGDPSEAAQPLRAPESPAELVLWSHWVKRLVSHFGSEVSYYEIWNEENTTAFWAQGTNPTEYRGSSRRATSPPRPPIPRPSSCSEA